MNPEIVSQWINNDRSPDNDQYYSRTLNFFGWEGEGVWDLIQIWVGVGGGGALDERLFEARSLFTFSAFRVGSNSRLGAYLNK